MKMKEVQKTFVERRVYDGALVKRGYRVSAIECSPCPKGQLPSELVRSSSLEEYSSGCPLHEGGCWGHVSVTPTGSVLPPHSLSFRSGDVRTQYYIAASKAFEQKGKEYIEELKKTGYGKEGAVRSILSTPVSGSARLVCIPHAFHDPRVVFISSTLASKILFCCIEVTDDGSPSSTYKERHVREGDYVMLERAPTLSKFNNQPLLVMYWDCDCLGVHPKVFSYFHGDYDGDEAHIYALDTPESIEEAKAWVAPLDRKLTAATKYMCENFPLQYGDVAQEGDMDFLRHTTLSFNEIEAGTLGLPLGDFTRNKKEHMKMFRERMNDVPGTTTFLRDSIKGVNDIMRQQLSQGKIGYMSRVSRDAAMCFTRGKEGGTYVSLRKSRVLLNRTTLASVGTPCVRCVMVLCQASQEAALHAHRPGSAALTGLDMISDMLRGRQDKGRDSPCYTLAVFENVHQQSLKDNCDVTLCYSKGGRVITVIKDSDVTTELASFVTAAYSPVILSSVAKERRKDVCRRAIEVVYNFYSLESEGDDIEDLVEAMCYRVEMSPLPVTTPEGMSDRRLSWIETLMASDYTKLEQLKDSTSEPWSAASAVFCSNFSQL